MLGQLNEWFFHDLAGIRNDPASAGFKHILIMPSIVGDLTWVKCCYDSIRGKIVSNWSLEGPKLTMEVTIPPNTTATIRVPTLFPIRLRNLAFLFPKPKASGSSAATPAPYFSGREAGVTASRLPLANETP